MRSTVIGPPTGSTGYDNKGYSHPLSELEARAQRWLVYGYDITTTTVLPTVDMGRACRRTPRLLNPGFAGLRVHMYVHMYVHAMRILCCLSEHTDCSTGVF